MESLPNEAESIRSKIDFYHKSHALPVIIMHGDSLWKKNLWGFKMIDLPGGRESSTSSPPKIKAKIGQVVTKDRYDNAFVGIGIVAANFFEKNADGFETFRHIMNVDPNAAGIAFVTHNGDILDWVDRSHAG